MAALSGNQACKVAPRQESGSEWSLFTLFHGDVRTPGGTLEGITMRLIRVAVCAMALLGGAQLVQAQEASDTGEDAFNNGDYAAALEAWQSTAAQGDPDAMTKVGQLYELGLGVKRDFDKAAEWYTKAAQLGFVVAQYNLANLYYDGRGVSRDKKQAARWYTAAAQGGHAKAQFYLAQMYMDGDGIDENKETGLSWFQKAAALGLPDAQHELGRRLIFGDDVAADPTKGTDLVLKAAEQRYAKAQILIADCYWKGRGVAKNEIEAYVWAAQAKEFAKGRDSKRAADLYDDVRSGMNGEQIKAAEIELMAVNPKKKKKNGAGGLEDLGSGDEDQDTGTTD
jgi:TPR repeat protein